MRDGCGDQSPEPPTVRRATGDDLDTVVAVLVDSHVDYIWERWALPWVDRGARLTALYPHEISELTVGGGEVWMTDCGRSVAVWIPMTSTASHGGAPSEMVERTSSLEAAFAERRRIVEEVEWTLAAHRPRSDWYLATMGTTRAARRRGLGAGVLRPRVNELDRAHETATLETSDPANLSFYGRLGFEVVTMLDDLPHAAPRTWIMLRRPANDERR